MLGYTGIVASQQAQGTLYNTYTTAKSVINPQALWTVPAGFFGNVGQAIEVEAWGGLSNIITTPGTITFQIMMGAVVAYTSGAIQLNATAHTTLPFHFRANLVLNSVGSGTSAKFIGMGEVSGIAFTLTAGQTDAANTGGIFAAPATLPAVGTGWDSTVANVLDFWAGFSISNAGNGIQIANYLVKSWN